MRLAIETTPNPIDAVTEPDVILPAQLFPELSALADPERRLRLAVLKDALRYVQRFEHATDPDARAVYDDAIDWIGDPDRSEPFAFENVCAALGLSPSYVRSCLRRWQQSARLRAVGPPTSPRSAWTGIGRRRRSTGADRRAA